MSHSDTPTAQAPQWSLLVLVLGVTAVAQLTFSAVPSVLPELAVALRVERSAIGLVQGIVALPGILLSVYVGYLLDRFGRRRVVRACLLLFGTAGSACFLVGNFWLMLGLRFVQGVGAATLLSIGVVLVGDQFTGHRRRWAMGLNAFAIAVAGTLWPILGGLIGAGGAFRPFLLYLLALPVWVAARRLPEPAHAFSPERPFAHLREALRDLRRRRQLADFIGMLPMSFLTLSVYMGFTLTLTPLFLEREFALTPTRRGLVIAIAAGTSSVASILSGRLGTRVRPSRVIAGALILEAAGFAAIGLGPSLWVVGLGLALVGSGTGSMTPLMQHFSTSVGKARYRGVLVGTWGTSNRLGMFAGPSGATAIAGGIGDRASYLVGAAAMAGLAVAWLPLRHLAASRTR